ncbi:hypothetical protein ACLB2K_054490 [Fragaria x ananassa]
MGVPDVEQPKVVQVLFPVLAAAVSTNSFDAALFDMTVICPRSGDGDGGVDVRRLQASRSDLGKPGALVIRSASPDICSLIAPRSSIAFQTSIMSRPYWLSLSSLRLQSCCLVSGEGLKALGTAVSSGLEELALINCDVVEREPGLLSTSGQNLKKLRKIGFVVQ